MSANNFRNCVCFSLFRYVKIERLLVHFNVVVHFIFGQQRGRKPAAPYQFFEAIPYKKSMYYAGIPTKSFTNPPWPIFKCSSHGAPHPMCTVSIYNVLDGEWDEWKECQCQQANEWASIDCCYCWQVKRLRLTTYKYNKLVAASNYRILCP